MKVHGDDVAAGIGLSCWEWGSKVLIRCRRGCQINVWVNLGRHDQIFIGKQSGNVVSVDQFFDFGLIASHIYVDRKNIINFSVVLRNPAMSSTVVIARL